MSEMKDSLIKILNAFPVWGKTLKDHWFDQAIERLADHLLANGVIVPPCKVGDTVYFVSRGEIIPMVVNCISFNGNYQYCLNCNYADEEKYGYSLLNFTDKVRGYMFGFTKEEAEKALAERKENER